MTEAALLAGSRYLKAAELLALAAPGAAERVRFHALSALAGHLDDPKVARFVLNALIEGAADPFTRTAVQVATRQHELPFLRQLAADDRWTVEQETETRFAQTLAQQLVRAEPGAAAAVLDEAQRADGAFWLRQALLLGLFERSREPGFERTLLSAPHPLFGTEDDVLWPAIAKARRAVTWPGDDLAADAKPLSPEAQRRMAEGARFYATSCANCHGADGAGIGALGPPLADSEWVTGPPERLARIVLDGVQGTDRSGGQSCGTAPCPGIEPIRASTTPWRAGC